MGECAERLEEKLSEHIQDARCYLIEHLAAVEKQYEKIHEDFRCLVDESLLSFQDLFRNLLISFLPDYRSQARQSICSAPSDKFLQQGEACSETAANFQRPCSTLVLST